MRGGGEQKSVTKDEIWTKGSVEGDDECKEGIKKRE